MELIMNLEKIFKNLIILDVIVSLFYIAIIFYMEWDVPLTEEIEPFTLADAIILIAFIFYYVALYFLYKFKPIGKTIYVPILILIIIIGYGYEYEYEYQTYEVTMEYLSGLVSGMIIALLYFTDIKDKFIKK
jgi:hypothetical protein